MKLHNGGSVLTLDSAGKIRQVFGGTYAGAPEGPPDLPDAETDVAAFVAAAKAAPYTYMSPPGDRNYNEEVAGNLVVPRSAATIVKIASGNWSNTATWDLGRVPQGGDVVLIPFGKLDIFDVEMTAADNTRPLEAECVDVRVDGQQHFSETVNTRMFINTHYTDMRGYFKIGSDEVPIQADKVAKIIIQSETDLDLVADPALQGRGILNHGMRRFRGATKTPFLYVAAHPMAGDTYIDVASAPVGWRVGDELMLPTAYYKREVVPDNGGTRDMADVTRQNELLVITSISTGIAGAGTRINIARHSSEPAGTGLRFNHNGPNPIGDTDETRVHLANMTRNIQIISPSAVNHRLGHTIDMHTMMANIYGVEHVNLGRTSKDGDDKVNPVWDIINGVIPSGGGVTVDINQTGRYPLHFHRTGTEILGTCEYSGNSLCTCDAAIAENCTVRGTPGWGFVHHSGRAKFTDCVAYDFKGAGFSAEKGDETGEWLNCLSIGARDNLGIYSEKEGGAPNFGELGVASRQTGKTGIGFWLLSRLVHLVNCQFADCNDGFRWGMRAKVEADSPLISSFDDTIPWDGFPAGSVISPSDPQLQRMDDCGGYASRRGWIIVKSNPNQPHHIRSLIHNFKCWEMADNVLEQEYIGLYLFENLYFHGLRFHPTTGAAVKANTSGALNGGISYGTNSGNLNHKNVKIVNFEKAICPGFRYTTLAPNGKRAGSFDEGGEYRTNTTIYNAVVDFTAVGCSFRYGYPAQGGIAPTNVLLPDTNPGQFRELTSAQLTNVLTYVQTPSTWTNAGGTGGEVPLNGTITDSIGQIPRSSQGLANIFRNVQLETKLKRDGYYTFGSKLVMLVDDVITDRVRTVYDATAARWKVKRLEFKTVITIGVSNTVWIALGGVVVDGVKQAGTLTNLGPLPAQYQPFVA